MPTPTDPLATAREARIVALEKQVAKLEQACTGTGN